MTAAASLLGRLLIVGIFLMSAVGNKIPNFNSVTQYMAAEGVPLPSLMLAGAIVFLIAGGLSVATGYQARLGAGLLFVFLVLATFFFHDFWTFEGEARQQQMIQFMKNLSLMGAMVFLMANGPGAMALGSSRAPAAATKSECDIAAAAERASQPA